MSSWTNNDIYVVSGFGTSSVNGYYFIDTTENHWLNSVNNSISLIFSGTYWWIRDKSIGVYGYRKYYYGVADVSGSCHGLTFDETLPLCEGSSPIGTVIYGGVFEENSSSSSSTSESSESSVIDVSSSSSSSSSGGFTSSSSSSSGLAPTVLIYSSLGRYADIQIKNGDIDNISNVIGTDGLTFASPFFKITQYENIVYAIYDVLLNLGVEPWKLNTLYDDGSMDYIKDLDDGYSGQGRRSYGIAGAVISKDIKEVSTSLVLGTPYLYVLSIGGILQVYSYKTWIRIRDFGFRLSNATALGEHNGKLYAAQNTNGIGQLVFLDLSATPTTPTGNAFNPTFIQNIPLWTRGLISVGGNFYGMSGNSTYLINLNNKSYSYIGTSSEYCFCLANGSKNAIEDNSSSSGSIETDDPAEETQTISSEEQLKLFSVIIDQGHNDILPFNFIKTTRELSGKILNFSYVTSGNNIPYKSIIDFTGNAANTTSSLITTATFVPETEEAKHKHEPIFYVDIIVEGDGVNQYSLRSQENLYIKENPTTTFNIPKFSWDNFIFGHGDSSESSQDDFGYVWVGTSSKLIHKIEYSNKFASVLFSANAPSEVYRINFGQIDNSIYVSCYDHIIRFIGASYYDGDVFNNEIEILNTNNDLVSLDDKQSGNLITTESYQGNLVFRDRKTLEDISSFSGFDAPFKVVWSKFHNYYFVAGTHTLWKFVAGEKTAVYNINNYTIVDFDVAETGVIGVIFEGQNSYIVRFLAPDLYTLLHSETINDGSARYCEYCEQGKFYVLVEINDSANYATNSIIFDSIRMTVQKQSSSIAIETTTTTTTLPHAINLIEMIFPVSTTILEKGSAYDIKWNSSGANTDLVKIELYKGLMLSDTITEQTFNTGVYSWTIPETYDNGTDYKIKVLWLSAGDTTNYDITDNFTITDIPQTTTTTTTKILSTSIGIEYNEYDHNIVNVLSNGMIALYGLFDFEVYGLFESGTSNVSCMALKDKKTNKFKGVNKVRVYVGSEPNISDKWDSGVIETEKTSMYYGGGWNLTPGNKYYVNIQVYSEKYGWSEIQTKSFIMPK